jgi:hypothetical protein
MSATFQEKYDRARPSYVRVNTNRFADLPAGTTILVPSPHDIELELRRLKPGEHIVPKELRSRLSERHRTEGTCPVMLGMHLRIVAEVALARIAAGVPMADVAPVWQVIAPESTLAQKLPGGAAHIIYLRDLGKEPG